jgi:hypothetical protein
MQQISQTARCASVEVSNFEVQDCSLWRTRVEKEDTETITQQIHPSSSQQSARPESDKVNLIFMSNLSAFSQEQITTSKFRMIQCGALGLRTLRQSFNNFLRVKLLLLTNLLR